MIFPSESRSAIFAEKWDSYIPEDASAYGAYIAGQLLENQKRYFDNLHPDTVALLEEIVGAEWDEIILRSLARSITRHGLIKLLSVQAMSGPIDRCAWLKYQLTHVSGPADLVAPMPSSTLKLMTEAVDAKARPMRMRLPNAATVAALQGRGTAGALVELAFEEAFNQVIHEALGACIHSAANTIETTRAGLRDAISMAAASIFRLTQRAPANRLFAHPEHCYDLYAFRGAGRGEVAMWPVFPKDIVLALRQGGSVFDSSVVVCPYLFTFHELEEDPEMDPETFERRPHGLVLSYRGATKVVMPEGCAVIKITDAPTHALTEFED